MGAKWWLNGGSTILKPAESSKLSTEEGVSWGLQRLKPEYGAWWVGRQVIRVIITPYRALPTLTDSQSAASPAAHFLISAFLLITQRKATEISPTTRPHGRRRARTGIYLAPLPSPLSPASLLPTKTPYSRTLQIRAARLAQLKQQGVGGGGGSGGRSQGGEGNEEEQKRSPIPSLSPTATAVTCKPC